MRYSNVIVSCVLFFTASLANAQEGAAVAGSFDLIQTYQLAVQNDAELQAAASTLQAEKEAKPQALADLLPNISAKVNSGNLRNESTSAGRSTDEYRDEGFSVSLTQTLFNWQQFGRLDQANKEVLRAGIQYQLAEQELILRVTERYLNTLTAQASLSLANDNVKAFQQQLEQAKFRFEVGIVAITDVHDAQARHDLAVASKISAEDGVSSTREALLEVIQTDYTQLAALKKEFVAVSPEPNNISDWENTASQHNLAVKIASSNVAIAKKQISILQSGHLPTLDFVASHSYNETGDDHFSSESDRIGVELNIPLFSGGKTSSRVQQAVKLHQVSLDSLKSTQRTNKRETRDAFRGVNASLHRISALKQATISNQSSLEASEAGLGAGTRTIVDVLDAQSNLTSAKFELIKEKEKYLLEVLKLKSAAGTLSTIDLEQINQWLSH